jgi:hypothetical protein
MAGLLSTDNAIAWAQFQLRGGWKSISLNAGGYFLLICGAIVLTCRLSGDRNLNNTLAGWTMGLLGLQALFIVIIGGMRVTTAIKQDITTGIMESHRMMPVPALHAIAGYLLGTMTAALGFFVANVAIGLATTLMAGNPAGRWIGANLVLLLFTIFLWVLFAFAAFTAPKGVGALFSILPTIGWISQGAMFNVLPGLGVMAGPLLGGTIFSMRSNTTELSGPVITSAAVQFLMGSIFFAGAMRKYRRPEGLALGVVLSHLLLLMWVACNMLAILRPADFHIGMRWKQNENAAYIGAMISSMLLALVPLANGARIYVQWLKRRVDDPQAKAALSPVVLAIMSAGIMSLIIMAAPKSPPRVDPLMTAMVFFFYSLAVVYVTAWVYLATESAKWFIGVWLLVIGALLPLADLSVAAATNADHAMGILSSLSPWGALIEIGSKSDVNVRAGVLTQMFYWLIPWIMYRRRLAAEMKLMQPELAA